MLCFINSQRTIISSARFLISISSLCCRKRVQIFIDVADGTFYSLQYDSPTIPSDLWRTLSEAARVLADEEFLCRWTHTEFATFLTHVPYEIELKQRRRTYLTKGTHLVTDNERHEKWLIFARVDGAAALL
jgi:hypothetical protein